MNAPINRPPISDVIHKIKQKRELTLEEEFVYLTIIEKLPEENASQLLSAWYEDPGSSYVA